MSDFIKIIKMQQLKQVIKSRIKDIKQLQQTNFINIPPKLTSSSTSISNSSHSTCSPTTKNIQRYELILKQRNGQQYRNSRQIVMLSIANGCGFNLTYQQLENVVFQVCVAYEADLQRDSTCTDPKERIYRLLRGFFTRNGFKQKLGHLKTIFNRSCSMSVGLIFTLFSQWSKKQYLNALSAQVKQIKSRYLSQPIPHSPSNDKLPQTLQLEASIKSQKSVSSITLNINSVRSEPIQKQKPKNITNLNLNLNTKMNMNSDSNNSGLNKLINSTNKIGSVGCVNSGKLMTIYNRSTLYGYFIQDLESYYQLTGMEGLDKGFIKSIGKRKMKENLVFVQNMNRAIQVLIQCSNNKQQRSIIRDYSQNYNHHKQAQPMPKMKKSNPNPLPSLSPYRIDLNHTKVVNTNINMKANIRNVSDNLSDNDVTKCSEDENHYNHNQNGNNKKFSVDSGCAQFRDRDQSMCGLSKNMSSALLGAGEESEGILNNIRENIKKKLIYRTVQQNQSANPKNLNRIKFPSLSRSMQKKQKVALIQKSKLYRFPTQQEQAVQSKAEDQSYELFKFSQRQTIKGIIIKNFLSVRQKQKNKKNKQESQMNNLSIRNKQEECSARKNHLKIESEEREQQCKEKERQKQKQKQKKNIEAVDIRSLRQKTKALLKNYKVMQNY